MTVLNFLGKIGFISVAITVLILSSCNFAGKSHQSPDLSQYEHSRLIHTLNLYLTEAIIQDGFTPPVASRVYAYPNIAAYECLVGANDSLQSLQGQLNELLVGSIPKPAHPIDHRVALINAFTDVAVTLTYRDFVVEKARDLLLSELKGEIADETLFNQSGEYGKQVAKAIIEWEKDDKYNETRKYPLYELKKTPGSWEPTPPTYKEAVEPHWAKLRPFVMDSAGMFAPTAPAKFDTTAESEFYKLAMEVYQAAYNPNDSLVEVARFWDCNPQVTQNTGHLTYAKRQLTPGGHWMGITRIITNHQKTGLFRTTEIYAQVAIALADGFISAWDEKYRSNLIRPETYVNRYIDPVWRPKLETPLFPEHTSAHSVVSGASSTILINFFGDKMAYIDSVNVPFGPPARSFGSFSAAADEAAISRYYGGIHYMPAITEGSRQGREIGKLILNRLKTRKY